MNRSRLACLVRQLLLVLMALTHIADVDHHPRHGRIAETVGDSRPNMMPAAVTVSKSSLDLERKSIATGDTPIP